MEIIIQSKMYVFLRFYCVKNEYVAYSSLSSQPSQLDSKTISKWQRGDNVIYTTIHQVY